MDNPNRVIAQQALSILLLPAWSYPPTYSSRIASRTLDWGNTNGPSKTTLVQIFRHSIPLYTPLDPHWSVTVSHLLRSSLTHRIPTIHSFIGVSSAQSQAADTSIPIHLPWPLEAPPQRLGCTASRTDPTLCICSNFLGVYLSPRSHQPFPRNVGLLRFLGTLSSKIARLTRSLGSMAWPVCHP